MFDKTRTRLEDQAVTAIKNSSQPLITVLYSILAVLGAIFLALVTRA